jgi:hypothetical protein
MFNKRVVNLRFKVCGLHFDAAIDCDWTLHCYADREKDVTPIELYCFDHTEWDIRMMYHEERNDQQTYKGGLLKTCANMDAIKAEARKWVREMRKK